MTPNVIPSLQSVSHSINQSTNQSVNLWINQPISEPTARCNNQTTRFVEHFFPFGTHQGSQQAATGKSTPSTRCLQAFDNIAHHAAAQDHVAKSACNQRVRLWKMQLLLLDARAQQNAWLLEMPKSHRYHGHQDVHCSACSQKKIKTSYTIRLGVACLLHAAEASYAQQLSSWIEIVYLWGNLWVALHPSNSHPE